MEKLIETPAVWQGQELLSRKDWLWTLSKSEIDELITCAKETADCELSEISLDTFTLPTLTKRLSDLQTSLENGSGVTLIRGLPVEEFSTEEATRVFLGLAEHLGTPLSQSATGERIFHVRDEGFKLDDPRARGPNTRKRLSFHTDRCDVIAFMCLRQAKSGGENDLVSSAALYNEIHRRRPDLLAELMSPFYYQRHNVDLGNQLPYCQQPVFSFCEEHFAGSYLRVLIDRAYASNNVPVMTEKQHEALEFLEAVAEEERMHVRIKQEPGDILLLNNWVTFHRRSEFEDWSEPALKRHILRVWLSVPNSRPIDPLFKENYGETAAGAIRGGMKPRSE